MPGRLALIVLALAAPSFAFAQPADAPSPGAAASAPDPMAGHDMSTHGHDRSTSDGQGSPSTAHTGHDPEMKSALGPYSMRRDGSGTSWQPDATPMQGVHLAAGDWAAMAHGFVNVVHDEQTGPRGDTKGFSQSMAMLMANRRAGPGTLGLRAMVSLDPTMGKSGYPLVFQTGETADGATPLVDRQHPHDFFMELSTTYSIPFGDDGAAFAYFGLPGEPALGPPAFMHRFSGMRNPEAPLTHHWLDSTHITFGVATLGVSRGAMQLEASWFNGREPDQLRWNIETRRFDSWSARLSVNPVRALSMQVSYGDLASPEQLEPDVRVRRTTASATYHADLRDVQWASTIAYGRNRKTGPGVDSSEAAWLVESTWAFRDTHTIFARAEQVENSELFAHGDPLHGEAFRIRKLSVGYVYDFAKTGPLKWGVGGVVGFLSAPSRLDATYGSHPRSYMVFLQGRL